MEGAKLLHDRRIALCISDSSGDMDVPFVSTGGWGYLRLRQPAYTDVDLKRWIKLIQDQNWRETFVFFKHETTGPSIAKKFFELAGKSPHE